LDKSNELVNCNVEYPASLGKVRPDVPGFYHLSMALRIFVARSCWVSGLFRRLTPGSSSTVSQALALLDGTGCDAAIIDYNLKGETAEAISDSLKAKNRPFVFASVDHAFACDERLRSYPMLSKPHVFEHLDGILAQLLDGKAHASG
jgi:hypothetical protein